MSITFATIELVHVTCYKCCAVYGLNKAFHTRALENKANSWYCPHCGVGNIFSADKIAALQREKESLERSLGMHRSMLSEARAVTKHVEAQRNGLKGALVRQSKRIKNGVCPCCTRSFVNLQRHMKTEHPSYALSAPSSAPPPSPLSGSPGD